mgnify:FL=1
MENAPQITLLFTALFVLISVPMSISVGLRRVETGVMLLHGDDDVLLRRMRAHGNFTEYVPLALLGLAGVELVGAPVWLVIACGGVLLAARLIHYAGLRASADSKGRLIGAALTSLMMLVSGAVILLALAGIL